MAMKVIELLTISGEILKVMHENGIKIDDYKYVPLYNDYVAMKAQGLKVTYIIAVLSQKYNICERKVYKVIRAMNQYCRIRALSNR